MPRGSASPALASLRTWRADHFARTLGRRGACPPRPRPQASAQSVFSYEAGEAEHVSAGALSCTGKEAALGDCQLSPAGRVSSAGDGECKAGDGLIGVQCGQPTTSGPEVCYLTEAGQRECWGVGGSGSGATMVCGSAGRRRPTTLAQHGSGASKRSGHHHAALPG